jgi:hypothetical protein
MKIRIALTLGIALIFGGACSAQTRITGAFECDKPALQYTIAIGAAAGANSPQAAAPPGNVLVLRQSNCTWTKPPQIAAATPRDGRNSATSDVDGSRSHDAGYFEVALDNGDEFTLRYTGMALLADGVAQKMTGTWTLFGGTGKVTGITGRGTYNGTGSADGTTAVRIVGEYQMPRK